MVDANLTEILDIVYEAINKSDSTNIGDVVIWAIFICIFFIPIFKAITSFSIEELFWESKEKWRNAIFKLIALLFLCTLANFVLAIDNTFVLVELLLVCIGIVVFILYSFKKILIKKYSESQNELINYYDYKITNSSLFVIISIMPAMVICINILIPNIPKINGAILVSVVEVIIISLLMPEIIKHDSSCYIIYEDKKLYIYERVDSDTFLCGENTKLYNSKKYKLIAYDTLKEKEIIIEPFGKLSKNRKQDLIKKYKKSKKKRYTKKTNK